MHRMTGEETSLVKDLQFHVRALEIMMLGCQMGCTPAIPFPSNPEESILIILGDLNLGFRNLCSFVLFMAIGSSQW